MNNIDFVILWVDGSDPAWLREFAAARHLTEEDARAIRYRDTGTLRYWFRSVERFAPWVRRIHFVTWGHLPAWLDTSNPKLNIVRHEDFIPAEYRPTFNSNTIELNINRIEGLAERFVLFNDDTFLCRQAREEDFFRHGLPCDMARLAVVQPSPVAHTIYNNLTLINALHNQRTVLHSHFGKWFSMKYGLSNLLKSLTLAPWSFFTGIFDTHQPQAYLKSQFDRAWELWPGELDASCRNTFRTTSDLSHWLVRYDRLCRGEFAPRNFGDCRLADLNDTTLESICNTIRHGTARMLCINDSEQIADFEALTARLQAAFEELLPEKSSYEH